MAAMDLITRFGGGGVGGGGAPTGGGSAFLPGSPNHYDPAYGGVPRVPNPTTTASTAIGGNLGNLQNLYGLATGTGSASGAGVISALNSEIPGVSGSIGSATGNINELLSGQVPQDVITQLQQQSAEMGAGAGMGPMSPFSNASYLRSLGLTSLGMKQQGLSALNSLMGSVPRAPAFDPSSMLVSPGQEQEAAYLAQVLGNAPVPSAAARANLDALRAGTGVSGSPVGGFNLPVHGGPAFATPPLTSPEYGPAQVYGPSGGGATSPEIDPYAHWRNTYMNSGAVPGTDMTSPDSDYLASIYGDQGGAADQQYYDPESMDSMYGF
jgi:hypothetical protein